jgi:hypothetical protein
MLWRATPNDVSHLLGGGTLDAPPRQLYGTMVLWTNPDAPGLRDAAMNLGYGGGTAMSFLRLVHPVICEDCPPLPELGPITTHLNIATGGDLDVLAAALELA